MKKIGNIEFYNLTPHPIHVRRNKQIVVFKPDQVPLRIKLGVKERTGIGPFRCDVVEVAEIPDLPVVLKKGENFQVYIVSLPTLMAVKARLGFVPSHLVAPNTDKAERDQSGNIVYVPGFIRLE